VVGPIVGDLLGGVEGNVVRVGLNVGEGDGGTDGDTVGCVDGDMVRLVLDVGEVVGV